MIVIVFIPVCIKLYKDNKDTKRYIIFSLVYLLKQLKHSDFKPIITLKSIKYLFNCILQLNVY